MYLIYNTKRYRSSTSNEPNHNIYIFVDKTNNIDISLFVTKLKKIHFYIINSLQNT